MFLFINIEVLSDYVRQDPLKDMVDGKHTPKFQGCFDFGGVVTHQELECEECRNVKSQKLTDLTNVYLTKLSNA